LLKYAHDEQLPLHILGSGSNCLVADDGLPGITISLSKSFKSIKVETDGHVRAEAGVMLGHMVKLCLAQDLTGMESLIGVPGTMGGALKMNAGAYGMEISNFIATVDVITLNGEQKTYTRDELEFSYRCSSFTDDELITSATFVFAPSDHATITNLKTAASESRKKSQPLKYRSAGSIFRNPSDKLAAGKLIDQAGLKGTRRGDAQISDHHANFIVNLGNATANDVVYLIRLAARTVALQAGVQLQLEIKTPGFATDFWGGINDN
jgi:UDP-N-acetylmuramate dehydrogenase